MSSNSLVPTLAFVFACTTFAAEVKCPSYQSNHPLSSIVLFDGPPEEKADLMPDQSTGSGDHANSSWDVRYIFANGRTLSVVCRYFGLSDSKNVTIRVEKKVQRCVFRTHPIGQPAELTCN
jgi:hypothetical protein